MITIKKNSNISNTLDFLKIRHITNLVLYSKLFYSSNSEIFQIFMIDINRYYMFDYPVSSKFELQSVIKECMLCL